MGGKEERRDHSEVMKTRVFLSRVGGSDWRDRGGHRH